MVQVLLEPQQAAVAVVAAIREHQELQEMVGMVTMVKPDRQVRLKYQRLAVN
jgi:hypothetical protein